MADNRMYVKCDVCGKAVLLVKLSGDAWWTPLESEFVFDRFTTFLNDHFQCQERTNDRDHADFSIAYQITGDGTRTDYSPVSAVTETPELRQQT